MTNFKYYLLASVNQTAGVASPSLGKPLPQTWASVRYKEDSARQDSEVTHIKQRTGVEWRAARDGPNRKEITQVLEFGKGEESGALFVQEYIEPHSLPSGDCLLREGGNSWK